MPIFMPSDSEALLSIDNAQSNIEGRTVSNALPMHMSNSFSILLVGGTTAGLTIWANNSKPSLDDRRYPETAYLQPQSSLSLTAVGYVSNLSFTGNWINITTAPMITVSSSGFFGGDCSFRYIRLQGASLSAVNGYFWGTDYISK